jgi:HPt (histidine-containing phosphotransfer) domain-containing protein
LTSALSSLDETALMTLVGGDRELACQLAALFLEELGPRVTEITTAVSELDAKRLYAGAHALRGSAGSIKADVVAATAGVLEAMGRASKLDGVQRALEELTIAVATVRPRLVALAARP